MKGIAKTVWDSLSRLQARKGSTDEDHIRPLALPTIEARDVYVIPIHVLQKSLQVMSMRIRMVMRIDYHHLLPVSHSKISTIILYMRGCFVFVLSAVLDNRPRAWNNGDTNH